MFYLLLLLSIFITHIVIEKMMKFKNRNIWFLNIAFLEMLLFLGLRDITIGIDLKNYIPYFNFIKRLSLDNLFFLDLEKGYIILNKVIGLFGDAHLFLFIVACISLFGVYFSIRKYSQNYFLSIYIYITFQFFIFLFSGLRQSIAFSIMWISLKYVKERKLFKFLLLNLLAVNFHKSAIVAIPIYIFANKRITLKNYFTFISVLFVAFVFKKQLLGIVTRYIYSNYDIVESSEGYNFLLLLFLFLMFFIFIRNIKTDETFRDNDIWFNMLIIGIIIQAFSSLQGNIARLTMYYSYSLVFLIPNTLEQLENKQTKEIIKVAICIFLFAFFYMNVQSETLYIPYKVFFS